MSELLAKLDELIALQKAARIKDRWLDADALAAMFSRSRRYVLERLVILPGFPEPLPGNRWLESEVQEWALEYRKQKTSRAA